MKPILLKTLVAGAAITFVPQANADIVNMIHVGQADGFIGSTFFTNTSYTITTVTNTNQVQSFGANSFRVVHESSIIEIDGIGSFEFLAITQSVVNNLLSNVAFRAGAGIIVGPVNDVFSTWDMTTDIGPIHGVTSSIVQWDNSGPGVATTGGDLFLERIGGFGTPASFSSITVPSPTSISLFSCTALITSRRRR